MLIKGLKKLVYILKRVWACCMFVAGEGRGKVFICFHRIVAGIGIHSGFIKPFGSFVSLSDTQFKFNLEKHVLRLCISRIAAVFNLYL
ncbi:MAG: hypothetical protein ACRC3B_18850, partial [Bacteroidia bacterium]